MRLAGHVAHTGNVRNSYKFLVKEPEKERDHLEDLVVDVRILLKCILEK